MKRAAAPLALALLGACGASETPAPEPTEAAVIGAGEVRLPPQAGDFPALASKDCAEVAQFYLDAIAAGEWPQAALVWDDPVIDGARLAAVFAGYGEPKVDPAAPQVEGAAGSLYCTVAGTLTDAGDPAKAPLEGALVLRRVNDVPGATPEQLRWTLRSSSFVESLERSTRGEP